jgi:hypothetical protein
MSPDGSNQRQLTDGRERFDNSPAWSPDGKRIAFERTDCVHFPSGYVFCLGGSTLVINNDGSGLESILDHFGEFEHYSPIWSPDGQKLAFIGYQAGSGFSELFTVNADGRNSRNLTNTIDSDESDPAWQPVAVPILSSPRIIEAVARGKKLFITGQRFDDGAVVLINGEHNTTFNDLDDPAGKLIARKGAKRIVPGQTVTLQVRNLDGGLSAVFTFIRPFE